MNGTLAALMLGLAAFASGCATGTPDHERYEVRIDPAMGSFIPNTVAAFNAWHAAMPDLVSFDVRVTTSRCEKKTSCIDVYPVRVATISPLVAEAGNAVRDGFAVIAVGTDAPGFAEPTLYPTAILHEVGHALGLMHEPGTLMAHSQEGNPGFITCRDVQQAYRVRGWSWTCNGENPL